MRTRTALLTALLATAMAPAATTGLQARTVGVVCDCDANQIAFALAELTAAARQAGVAVRRVRPERADPDAWILRIRLAGRATGFEVADLPGGRPGALVAAADANAAMVALLDLAERVALDRRLPKRWRPRGIPAIARRGIKFNIPLDARTPSYDDTGDAAQANIPHMWDFAFWRDVLDELARHRYNTLTLWNPHPFPSIVQCPNYPDVALDDVCVTKIAPDRRTHREWRDPKYRRPENLRTVRRMTIDEKIAFWRRVMRHAHERGIAVHFITWNVFTDGATGKYGITPEQDNPRTIAYLRECVRETIRTYPLLAGIGTTAGERMRHRKGEFAKERFLWRAYGQGVRDAAAGLPGRRVRFIHRYWQSGVGPIWRDFGAKYDAGPFELSFKYARAHMYSHPDPPFADGLLGDLADHELTCWWNLRNDDIFCFRWGDPDYVRAFLAHLPPPEVTAGFHMGSDGYVWGRTHNDVAPAKRGRLEFRKHWYRTMLWGRLAYDPQLDRRFWRRVIARRLGLSDAAGLYDAWQRASKIIPLVNRFHWRNWDFMWAVEGCMDARKGFHTVEDFIAVGPMAGSGLLSIPAAAEGKGEGTGARQVAAELADHAAAALAGADAVRSAADPPAGGELADTLADIEAMAHLGRYYAAKILGAVELHAFRTAGKPGRQAAAVRQLTEAVGHWRAYAANASKRYRPQLLARTRVLDWRALLEDVRRDVTIARTARCGAEKP